MSEGPGPPGERLLRDALTTHPVEVISAGRQLHRRAYTAALQFKPFSGWGEIFGDDIVAAAMIDRLVHHAEIVALKGDSYRLKDRDLTRPAKD